MGRLKLGPSERPTACSASPLPLSFANDAQERGKATASEESGAVSAFGRCLAGGQRERRKWRSAGRKWWIRAVSVPAYVEGSDSSASEDRLEGRALWRAQS